jgi:PKD repeat protein
MRLTKSIVYTTLIVVILFIAVPAACAEDNANITIAREVSAAPLPQLQFNDSQQQVAITGELSPGKTVQTTIQTSSAHRLTSTPASGEVTVPDGAIIYHANNVTTVFDQDGQQLLAADDTQAELVQTIDGSRSATFVHEVPNGSIIVDGGDRLFVVSDDTRILTVINENYDNTTSTYTPSSSDTCYGTPYNGQWIEGTEAVIGQTTTGYTFRADWNVPQSPNTNYPVTIWNGLYSCKNSNTNNTALIQPVLQWATVNGDANGVKQWYLQTWYIPVNATTRDDHFSTPVSGSISPGDLIRGYVSIGADASSVSGWIMDVNTGMVSTLTTTYFKYSPDWANVNQITYAEIVLEGASPVFQSASENLTGPVTFNNFVMTDSDGTNLLPQISMTPFINSQHWNQTTFNGYNNLSVINRWPTDVTLVNNPNRVNRPVADFSASSSLYGMGVLYVPFVDSSTGNPFLWLWDFGDSKNSTEQNPLHYYSSAGTYTVNLTVWNAGGNNSSVRSNYITVYTPLIPVFHVNTNSGTTPLTVQFNDTSTGNATTWNWSFGDGYTSTLRNVSHTYTSKGIYNATLTIGNALGTNTSAPQAITVSSPPARIGVFRNSTGYWYLDTNLDGTVDRSVHFGISGDTPVVGDFNGDGTTDIGVFRNSTGNWYLDTNFDGTAETTVHLGTSGDIPVVGDWNNAGHSEIGVFRPSTGYWYLDTNLDGTVDRSVHFGNSSDTPVVGDFNGDKTTDLGVFRNPTAYWYLDTNFDGTADTAVHFGNSSDTPVVGNWA